jgi:hypothetical protein
MADLRYIEDLIETKARADGGYAVAYGLLALTKATHAIAEQLNRLGLKDACTPMGALEHVSLELKGIGRALEAVAAAVGELDIGPVSHDDVPE